MWKLPTAKRVGVVARLLSAGLACAASAALGTAAGSLMVQLWPRGPHYANARDLTAGASLDCIYLVAVGAMVVGLGHVVDRRPVPAAVWFALRWCLLAGAAWVVLYNASAFFC
jgi:hypothetical protein